MQTLENKRFSEQRAVVRALVMRYKVVRFAVDQTGMGESFVEDLQDQHSRSRVEGVLMTSNRRLDIATELKRVHEDRLIRIPDDEATELDLHSIKREAGPTGAPRLVASENDTDDHADRYWSLGLAAAAAGSGVPTTVATGTAADRQGRRCGEQRNRINCPATASRIRAPIGLRT